MECFSFKCLHVILACMGGKVFKRRPPLTAPINSNFIVFEVSTSSTALTILAHVILLLRQCGSSLITLLDQRVPDIIQ